MVLEFNEVGPNLGASEEECFDYWFQEAVDGDVQQRFRALLEQEQKKAPGATASSFATDLLESIVDEQLEQAGKEEEENSSCCTECKVPLGEMHHSRCGKRVVGCPEVVADDCTTTE